jgi:predicted lipid-binding transport protein (Tim44 family)
MKVFALILTLCLLVVGVDAEAKRLGGGRSFGKQSGNVTQRDTTPAAPAAPAQAANANTANAAPRAPVAAAAPQRPWGAMLGGVAAGLGLAWLASSLGLGAAFGQFMVFALLALVIMLAVGWFMRRRRNGNARAGGAHKPSGYALQSAGATHWASSSYSPEHVGNDASARPWERTSMAFQAQPAQGTNSDASMIGSGLDSAMGGLSGAQSWGVPADFDVIGFLTSAKQNFITLQAAWDKSDITSLRAMMTDDMLGEIKSQLAEREQHTGVGTNSTEVAALDAKLLGIEDLGGAWMASVEFSGMIKEDPAQSPAPFREVWNMTRSKTVRGGWLVAGVQALQ